jgi:hypothetical protein
MLHIMPVKASDNVPEKAGLGEMGAMWRSQVYARALRAQGP